MSSVKQIIDPGLVAIYAPPVVDNSIYARDDVRLNEDTSGGTITINMQTLTFTSKDLSGFKEFRKGSNPYIEFLCYLADKTSVSNGQPVPLDANSAEYTEMVGSGVAPIRSAELYINNVIIEQVNYSFIRGLVTNLLTKRTDHPKQASEWYYPEICNTATRGLLSDPTQPVANSSFIKRAIRRSACNQKLDGTLDGTITPNSSNMLCYQVPLADLFGYFRDVSADIVGQEVKIVLNLALPGQGVQKGYTAAAGPNPPQYTNTVADAAIVVTRAFLWYHMVKPQDDVKTELLTNLSEGKKVCYMWRQHDVYDLQNFAISGGQQTAQLSSKFAKLHRIYIMAQVLPRTQSASRQAFNSAVFDPIAFNDLRITINGAVAFPNASAPLVGMSWASRKDVERIYKNFIMAQRSYGIDESGLLDFESFMKAYPIQAFDLSTPGQAVYDQTSQSIIRIDWNSTGLLVNAPVHDAVANGSTTANSVMSYIPSGYSGYGGANLLTTDPAYVNNTTDQFFKLWAVVEVERSVFGRGAGSTIVFDQLSSAN